jgi:cell pole-organizing protein PopZ
MSSFDKTAGKNLDEILASIRKTLADESPHPDVKGAMPRVAADAKVAAAANLNGSKPAADKIDDDLADLLAGGLGTPAATPVPGPKDRAGVGDPKDPLWFLRPNEGRESQVLPLPADRVSPSFEALANGPANPAPERSSLAPLFVADTGSQPLPTVTGLTSAPAQANAASVPASAEPRTPIEAKPSAKTSVGDTAVPPANASKEAAPSAPLPEIAKGPDTPVKVPTPAPTAATSALKADVPKPGTPASAPTAAGAAAAPLKSSGSAVPATAPNPVRPAEPARPTAASAAAPLRAALASSLGVPANSAPGASARAAALNGAAPTAASSSAAASSAMVPGAQTQALEQIIEQLLEPLLRRWVDANLPRLVDAAIRAEVVRVLDAKHLNGQDTDRKV